jgi:hypothetical protein
MSVSLKSYLQVEVHLICIDFVLEYSYISPLSLHDNHQSPLAHMFSNSLYVQTVLHTGIPLLLEDKK